MCSTFKVYASARVLQMAQHGAAAERQRRRDRLAFLTRSKASDPEEENMRPLIGELTALVMSTLLA